ncbi:hypothetical protein M0R72_21895 [Candidatus Pacearchaeota archaeon]|nr:hypothetical protein [Candidatus Pacearchaeota archaeon]
MASFLKRNWPLLALFVAVGVILTLLMALDRAQDDAIAAMMADRSMAQVRARDAAIVAKYQPQIAAKDQELATLRQGVQNLSAKVVEKHRQLTEAQAKVKDLAGCQVLLDDARAYILAIDADYTAQLSEYDRLWGEKFDLKAQECDERIAALTAKLGSVTESAYKAALANRKKLVIGPQVHYGTGGMSVGFGITWELWRLRAPGQ